MIAKTKRPDRTRYKMIKADPAFYRMISEAKINRIKNGKDSLPRSIPRLTRAITRIPNIKNMLENSDFVEDTSAQFSVFNIFTYMIVGFLAVVLFGGLIWISGQLNTVFHQIGANNEVNAGQPGYTNMTQAADNTFGKMDSSIQALRMVAITLIFSLILATVLASALVRVNPVFFFVYIMIVILAVIFSAPISNAYLTLLQSNIYDGNLTSFTGANWILLHLPLITTIMGIFGAIFMFANILRSGNEERGLY